MRRLDFSQAPRNSRPTLVIRGLLTALPRVSLARDPSRDERVAFVAGVPAALGTKLVAPLIANGWDSHSGDPYWMAVLATAAAAAAGVFIVASGIDELGGGGIVSMIQVAVALGTAAFLAFPCWPRGRDEGSTASPEGAADVAIPPGWNGGVVQKRWRF